MSNAEQRCPENGLAEGFDASAGRFVAVLPKLVAEVASELTTSAVASRIATTFLHTLGARRARVYLSNPVRGTFDLAAAEDVDAPVFARLHAPDEADDPPAAAAIHLGLLQCTEVPDAPSSRRPRGAGAPPIAIATRASVAIPLFAEATTIGAVSAIFDAMSLEECAALRPLSDSLGAILDGARLRAEVARLEGAARARDAHLALASHELRQPLNVLLVTANHLAKWAHAGERPALERLRAAAMRLKGTVSDLSDAAFLESGNFTLHVVRTDVADLVTGLVAELAPSARVSIEGVIPAIEIDPHRMEQILTNLLANAEKYGRAGTSPHVAVTSSGRVVVISVSSDGGGISDDERTKVFEPYYRARDRNPERGGQGLGLYICKKLVEEHGGRIWADGDPSETRLSFSLPIGAPAAESGTRACAASSAGARE
jgi:signal transduction histidine kinase